jgi:hypothetical protein
VPGKGFPALIQFRSTDEMRERMELAAAECEMSPGEWMRAITDGALAVHFDQEAGVEDDTIPEPEVDPSEYINKLEEDAKVLRAQERPIAPEVMHPGLHDTVPATGAKRNPRDCPHLPQHQVGGRCTDCGQQLGGTNRGSLSAIGGGFRRSV